MDDLKAPKRLSLEVDNLKSAFLTDFDHKKIETITQENDAVSLTSITSSILEELKYPEEMMSGPIGRQTKITSIPGKLQMSPLVTKKYFGKAARDRFFSRYRNGPNPLFFDDEPKENYLKDIPFHPMRPVLDSIPIEYREKEDELRRKMTFNSNLLSPTPAKRGDLPTLDPSVVLSTYGTTSVLESESSIKGKLSQDNSPGKRKSSLYSAGIAVMASLHKSKPEKVVAPSPVQRRHSAIGSLANKKDGDDNRCLTSAEFLDENSEISEDEKSLESFESDWSDETEKFSVGGNSRFSDVSTSYNSLNSLEASLTRNKSDNKIFSSKDAGLLGKSRYKFKRLMLKESSSAAKKLSKLVFEKSASMSTLTEPEEDFDGGPSLAISQSIVSFDPSWDRKSTTSTVDDELERLVLPVTPRSSYIKTCLQEKMNPRPSLIVRKKFVQELNLEHQGMGDKMACALAESLKSLPYISSINLDDNNLTDAGMCPVLSSVLSIGNLMELNLSHNTIGPGSAFALGQFLSQPNCPLVKLILQNADVDDYECQNFMQAVKDNKTLKEIDLSNNKIGSAENLNTVMPDIITGGEAIADFLRNNTSVEVLKLAWNMIRLDGAVELVQSLSYNNTLTYLDLSYNALGRAAGIELGDAILDNKSLKTLLVRNNGLQAAACFTICQGIIENKNLAHVALDGNPIGELGARSLMMIPMLLGSRCTVTAEDCNVGIKDPDAGSFSLSDPCGIYSLKLNNPFDRAKAFALLRVSAQHQTFKISKCVYDGTGSSKNRSAGSVEMLDLTEGISNEKESVLDESDKKLVTYLRNMIKAAENPVFAGKLFSSLDTEKTGELNIDAFEKLLELIGMRTSRPKVIEIVKLFDVDNCGTIAKDEFLLYLEQQLETSIRKLKDLTEEPIIVLASGASRSCIGNSYSITGQRRYIPPKTGVLNLTIADGFLRKKIFKSLSATDRKHVFDLALSSGKAVEMITYSVTNVKLRLDEALYLFDAMYKECRNKVKSATILLPHVADFAEAKQFVSTVTEDDRVELQMIRQGLGPIMRPIFGQPDGYYCLDLSKPMDALCLGKLLEISKSINSRRLVQRTELLSNGGRNKQSVLLNPGDTSQHKNWSCFRNEIKDFVLPIQITPELFNPMPTRGMIEFDFCCGSFVDLLEVMSANGDVGTLEAPVTSINSIPSAASSIPTSPAKPTGPSSPTNPALKKKKSKPQVATAQPTEEIKHGRILPLSDRRFLRILVNCCLLKTVDINSKVYHLKYLKAICDNTLEVDKNSTNCNSKLHVRSPQLGNSIFMAMEKFYDGLTYRYEKFLRRAKNEEIKVNYLTAQLPMIKQSGSLDSQDSAARPRFDSDSGSVNANIGNTILVNNSNIRKRKKASNSGKIAEKDLVRYSSTDYDGRPFEGLPDGNFLYVFDEDDPDLQLNDTSVASSEKCAPKESKAKAKTVRKFRRVVNDAVEIKELKSEEVAEEQDQSILARINRLANEAMKTRDPEHKAMLEAKIDRLKEERVVKRRINFKKLLFSPNISPQAKAARVLEVLEDLLNRVFISCRQLTVLLECFPQGKIWSSGTFSSYRTDIVISVFSRIIDVQNMELVFNELTPEEVGVLYCRLGWFNLFNPMKCEGYWKMNMSRNVEDRQFAKIFIGLSLIEPGVNWKNQSFQWSSAEEPVGGWDLTQAWTTENGMAKKGIIGFTYFSGDGVGADGCLPCADFRRSLFLTTLINEKDLLADEKRFDPSFHPVPGELMPSMTHVENNLKLWTDFMLKVPGEDDDEAKPKPKKK